MTATRELELRAHVHNLLEDYALTHLTTNYVVFTNNAVSEVLSETLYTLPTTESTSLALEPPLSELIQDTLKLSHLPAFEERWETDALAAQHLRSILKPPTNDPSTAGKRYSARSIRCWEEDHDDLENLRPVSPVLTCRAIRETPKLGQRPAAEYAPGPRSSLLKIHGIDIVDISAADDQLRGRDNPNVSASDILGHKLAIDPQTRESVYDLLKPIVGRAATNADKNPRNAYIDDFLQTSGRRSPPHELHPLISPPLFPRDRKPGNPLTCKEDGPTALSGFKDLHDLIVKADVGSDDSVDLFREHLKVVNGWETYRIPSSPTPSLGTSSSQDIDELAKQDVDTFLPSSPNVDGLFLDAIEVYEIPRTEKIGGKGDKVEGIGHGETLPSFLSFLQPAPRTPRKSSGKQSCEGNPEVKVITTPKSHPSSPHTAITASMVGQPATDLVAMDDTGFPSSDADVSENDGIGLRGVLSMLYPNDSSRSPGGFDVDPRDFILKEKLDERESYLMDVPALPPPNQHAPSDLNMPLKTMGLLVQTGAVPTGNSEPHTLQPVYRGFLTRTQVTKDFMSELSWRPFNYGSSIPTNEEVCRVIESIQTECMQDLSQDQCEAEVGRHDVELAKLLDRFQLAGDTSDALPVMAPSQHSWLDDSMDPVFYGLRDEPEDFVLSAAERRRMFYLSDPLARNEDELDYANVMQDIPEPNEDERPHKRQRQTLVSQDSALEQLYHADTYTDLYLDPAEDSGIYIPEAQEGGVCLPATHSRFGRLADDARGFDGPKDDGDLFPDIDPIHFDGSIPQNYVEYDLTGDSGCEVLPGAGWDLGVHRALDEISGPALYVERALLLYESVFDNAPGNEDGDELLPAPAESDKHAPALHPEAYVTRSRDSPYHDTGVLVAQSATQSLQEFMKLRSKTVHHSSAVLTHPPISELAEPGPEVEAAAINQPIQIPPELLDRHTFTSPDPPALPSISHCYLASLSFIQRRNLVRVLAGRGCSTSLVEREDLNGADLIIDPDTAVLFSPLRNLPTRYEALLDAIGQLSWRFVNILVVFETFPGDSHSHADNPHETLTVNPFSPPAVKALRRLRRDLAIAEACYNKSAEAIVAFAYPLTIAAAAQTLRAYGDVAHARDATAGALWADRRWLELDEEDWDERDLAAVDGMNVFAAAVVLSTVSLDEFLDKSAEERLDEFGGLIGRQRITTFNAVIARRREALELPSSSPPNTSIGTSNDAVPMERV